MSADEQGYKILSIGCLLCDWVWIYSMGEHYGDASLIFKEDNHNEQ